MKKKSVNKKKILYVLIPIIILAIIIGIALTVNKKNDENGVFSLLEKRWIEKNKTTVVDVSVINDVPSPSFTVFKFLCINALKFSSVKLVFVFDAISNTSS